MERIVTRLEGGQALGQRRRQEDAWGGGIRARGAWAAVADGIGGHRDGDRASQIAIDAIRQHMRTMTLPAETFSIDWATGSAWPNLMHNGVSVDAILSRAPWPDNATLVLLRHVSATTQ